MRKHGLVATFFKLNAALLLPGRCSGHVNLASVQIRHSRRSLASAKVERATWLRNFVSLRAKRGNPWIASCLAMTEKSGRVIRASR
jgi:hypothetical protein